VSLYTARKNFPQTFLCTIVAVLILISVTKPSLSATVHPLSTSNTRPVVLVHAIPTSRNAQLTAPGEWQVSLDTELTNHFSYNYDSNESVRFDGETTRVALSAKRRITHDAEMEVIVPFIKHDGGSLDQFIEDWHDFFGFPQNGRKNNPRNQLLFYYEKNGVVKLDFREPASGMGDIQLIFAVDMMEQHNPTTGNLALKTSLKLPTGDSDKLTGSGAGSVAVWLAGDQSLNFFGMDGLRYFSIGGMWMQEGDVIADQQRSFALFGGIGNGLKVSKRIALQVQLDAHTPLYQGSDLKEMGSVAFLLTMGGNLELSNNWNLDIAVVEDILPHSAPDVTFHLGINSRW